MQVNYKYGLGEKVYYIWENNKRNYVIYEGKIKGLSIRLGYKGKIIKTVDFKGINGVLEECVSTDREKLEKIIEELNT